MADFDQYSLFSGQNPVILRRDPCFRNVLCADELGAQDLSLITRHERGTVQHKGRDIRIVSIMEH